MIITLALVIGLISVERSVVSFNIPKSKTILVVGDSRSECAINDKLIDSVYNFSTSGAAYFYSYLKIRQMLIDNSHIKTVVLSYSYGDLLKTRDEWFDSEEKIKYFMPKYLFLFQFKDVLSMLKANTIDTILNIPRVVFQSSYQILKYRLSNHNLKSFGGYLHLEREKLSEAKKRYILDKVDKVRFSSKYQEKYLLKIYKLLKGKNIGLILLNLPTHSLLREEQSKQESFYSKFANEKMPKAVVINHSNMAFSDSDFGDLEHFNHKGAKIYSEYISKNISIFHPKSEHNIMGEH